MIKVHSSGIAMKVKIFSGNPANVEEEMAAFLADKHIRLHGLAQSQSATTDGSGINITATVLYAESSAEKKEVVGFNRP